MIRVNDLDTYTAADYAGYDFAFASEAPQLIFAVTLKTHTYSSGSLRGLGLQIGRTGLERSGVGIYEWEYTSITPDGYRLLHAAVKWVTGTGTAVESLEKGNPARFGLAQNYHNPFNPTTEIQFSITKDAQTTLTVYNALGQTVTNLVDQEFNAGTYCFFVRCKKSEFIRDIFL